MKIKESELILNPDGSVYHINLLPEEIAGTIFLVGDPERVPRVSQFFDSVEIKKEKREFVTHTGTLDGKKLTVISTGIGTDNIDIVLNELDALVNIDLKTREIKPEKKSLNFIRLGTSGSVNPNIDTGSIVAAHYSVGFDGLMQYYSDFKDEEWKYTFLENFKYENLKPLLYFSKGSDVLLNLFSDGSFVGNTGSLPGFYGPQGRELRLKALDNQFLEHLHKCGLDNFEMETSAIYGFSQMMGHQALSLNAIIANRTLGTFSENYKKDVEKLIQWALEKVK